MNKILSFTLALFTLGVPALAQTSLTQTTFTAAVNSSQTTVPLASVTGLQAPSPQTGSGYVVFADGEAMTVNRISGNYVSVTRGVSGTRAKGHVSGGGVLYGPPNAFMVNGPSGGELCTVGAGAFAYSPVVALNTNTQWLCSSLTGTVVPGFTNSVIPAGVSAAVASAAGLITPSGPLFHITGTAAITGFNIPVGLNPKQGAVVCVIPDAAFTTTNANNIAIASTGVIGKTLCWTYDPSTTKFNPSY